jgi:L-asparaginase
MFSSIKLLCLLSAVGYASPVVYPRATSDANPFVFTNYNGLNFTQMNVTLPNVTIFATGRLTSQSIIT